MSLYREQLLPRLMNVVMAGAELGEVRRRVASGLAGVVLEVGFGSGLNIPYYPPSVRRVLALDPATVGRKLAAKRVSQSHAAVEYLDAGDGTIPVATGSVDHVLVTWTVCSIVDPVPVLREMHRALRPGGKLHFVEHGLSPDPSVARWQDRLNPLQRAWAGGCNLNRPIDLLVEEAGFELQRLDNFYLGGPKAISYIYEGCAAKRASE